MGYQKLISVINEQSASTVLARYAISIAYEEKADLMFYAAHGEGTSKAKMLQTEQHLDHLFATAIALGIEVTRITEAGRITRLLPKRVETENADLVFYPLMPGEHYGAALQQHDVHALLKAVAADMAVMRVVHMGKPHPQRILVPLGSAVRDSSQRIKFISALARSFQSRATLFHLTRTNMSLDMPDAISQFRRELRLRHIEVEERSARGHVSKSIAIEAISRHNDLIVLGATERSALKRLFFGNPAGEVMFKPPCNAILFRAGA
jgi:nucleotide-binding universal stress UspA family protein